MRRYKTILTLLAAFCFAGMGIAADEDFSPWDAWRQGYGYFQRGEQARDRGDYVQALKEFREAARSYRSVQRARPDWNQKVIATRIALCEREIESARKLLGRPGAESASDAPAPIETPTPASSASTETPVASRTSYRAGSSELAQVQTELEQYKKRLFGALVELDDLRKQAARSKNTGTELENLMRERRVLQEKYDLLSTRFREQEKLLNEPNAALEIAKKQLVEQKINLETAARKLELAQQDAAVQEKEYAELQRSFNLQKKELEKHQRIIAANEQELASLQLYKNQSVAERNAILQRENECKIAQQKAEKLAAERLAELDTLNRRLSEAVKKGGDTGNLNAEISTENEKLRKSIEELRTERDTALADRRAVQNKLRTLQLELSEIKNSLQRLDDRRLQAEQEAKLLATQMERKNEAANLSAVELKNLRAQNTKLEDDLKVWAERLEKAEKRLEERRSADLANASSLNAERRDLREKLAQADVAAAEQKARIAQLDTALQSAEKRSTELNTALLKLRAEYMSSEQELKKVPLLNAEREKLAKELAEVKQQQRELQQNFAAQQQQITTDRERLKQLDELKLAQVSLKRQADAATELRAALATQEKSNQQLLDENARLGLLEKEHLAQRTRLVNRAAALEKDLLVLKSQSDKTAELESANKLLKNETARIADLEKTIALLKTENARLATLSSEIAELKKSASAAATLAQKQQTALAEQFAAERRRTEAQAQQQKAVEKTVADLQTERETLRKSTETLQRQVSQIDALKQQIALLEKQNATLTAGKKDLSALAKEQELNRRLQLEAAKLPDLEKNLADAQTQIKKLTGELGSLRATATETPKLAELSAQNALLQKNAAQQKKEFEKTQEALNASLAALKEKLTAATTSLQQEKQRSTLLAQEKTSVDSRQKRDLAMLQDSQRELLALRKQLNARMQENQTLVQEKQNLNAQVEALRNMPKTAIAPALPRATAPVTLTAADLPPVTIPATAAAPAASVEEMLKNARQAEKDAAKEVAIWNYRSILESVPAHFEANYRLGALLLADEKFADALPRLQKAHLLDTGHLGCRVAYANAQLGQKKYGNALALLEKAPRPAALANYDYLLAIGRAANGAGQAAEAEKYFRAAISLQAERTDALVEMARLLCAGTADRRGDAARYYERAKKAGAVPDAVLENSLGKLLNERSELIDFLASAAGEAEKHNDFASAIWYYGQLLDMDTDSTRFAVKLALYQLRSGHPDQAEKTLARSPENTESRILKSFIAFARKDYPGSVKWAEAARAANNGTPCKLAPEFLPLLAGLDQAPVEAAKSVESIRRSLRQ